MNTEELNALFQAGDFDTLIGELKNGRLTTSPDIGDYALFKKQLNPNLHDVSDPSVRRDKMVKTDDGHGSTRTEIVKVERIALALQKLIVKRAVAFLFGNEPTLTADLQNDVLDTVNAVFRDVKINTINRKVAKYMMSNREVAEYWYTVADAETNNRYGFPSPIRIKCAIFAPEKGDTLYPYFDENGDLIAFSREYSTTRGNDANRKTQTFFETYTATATYRWTLNEKTMELAEGYPIPNPIGKIPIVYGEQEKVEWADVQTLIDRLEVLLSNFADTNDYHASPKILVTGQILSWAKKGESGAVIEMADGGNAQYLSWSQAPEAVRLEIDTLLRMIYTISQTPDISFENVKSLGGVSGVALELLFMDSHLKVQEKREIFDEYLQRRINIVKEYLAMMNGTNAQFVADCRNTIITAEIKPLTLSDKQTALNQITTAYNNDLISPHTAITMTAQTLNTGANPDEEEDLIAEKKETTNQTEMMLGGM